MSNIVNIFKSRIGADPNASLLHQELASLYPALKGVRIEQVLRVERKSLGLPDMMQLFQLFAYPGAELPTFTTGLDINEGVIREIGYQRAWTDPELPSIEFACKAMGIDGLDWARMSTRYQFDGVNEVIADEIAARYLYNFQSQMIIPVGFQWDTLKPQGERQPEIEVDVAHMPMADLLQLSQDWRIFLEEYQWEKIQAYYMNKENGRKATRTETEKLAAYYGDHCNHTTLKSLGLLQDIVRTTTEANIPFIISAFHDNAGVIDFYDGWSIGIKGETHISPWLIDAIMAILTLHGGVIRDGLGVGLGGWPILSTAIFATRDPRMGWDNLYGTIHPKTLVRGAIQATKDYCNPMGIPMGWSQFLIHPRNIKAFALGHVVCMIPTKYAKKGVPRVGDLLILFGGRTGRDGLHGAVVSGASATIITFKSDKTHVQLGFPIIERTFMETIALLRDRGCFTAITDLGAAGLSCGAGEMGAKVRRLLQIAGIDPKTSGVWYNLAWVILKSAAMENWEIDLSESQERMVAAIDPDALPIVKEIFEDYGVEYSVIGMFTDTERCQVVHDPEIDHAGWINNPQPIMKPETMAVDLEYTFLEDVPLPKIEVKEPEKKLVPYAPILPDSSMPEGNMQWGRLLAELLGHYNICDQTVAARQFDQTVQRRTLRRYIGGNDERMPDDLTVLAPIYGKPYALGVANSINQFYGEIDPAKQGQIVYAQAIMKLVAAGFNPAEMATCVNIYTPRVTDCPENAWNLVQLVRHGYVFAEKKFRVYVISGKDSSSGTIYLVEIRYDAPLTINVLAIGKLPDKCRVIGKPFRHPGDLIFLYRPGLVKDELGGSVFFDMFGQRGDALPEIDLDEMSLGLKLFHEACGEIGDLNKYIPSASTVVDGGIIRRLYEMCRGENNGCNLNLLFDPQYLFSEAPGIVFATTRTEWLEKLPQESLSYLGVVTAEPSIVAVRKGRDVFNATINDLSLSWGKTFKEAIHA